jgi:predicted N-acetyltransferase YhbS
VTAAPDIGHLFECPQHGAAVADLIHEAFWITVPGATAAAMQDRLLQAAQRDSLPLCLVAVLGGEVVGAVNLVHCDDDAHPEWTPWLAGMVVAREWRGRGVGSALVRAMLAEARRLQLARLYLGTDGPGFYTRLGAVQHHAARPGFWFLRFELD